MHTTANLIIIFNNIHQNLILCLKCDFVAKMLHKGQYGGCITMLAQTNSLYTESNEISRSQLSGSSLVWPIFIEALEGNSYLGILNTQKKKQLNPWYVIMLVLLRWVLLRWYTFFWEPDSCDILLVYHQSDVIFPISYLCQFFVKFHGPPELSFWSCMVWPIFDQKHDG